MKVLISTYNPSGYLLACLNKLKASCDVLVLYVPYKRIAISDTSKLKWVDRTTLTRKELTLVAKDFVPDLYICGGWMDKDYIHIARKLKNKACCVIQMDTPWQGKLSQFCHCLISRFYLIPFFDFFWCAGAAQISYAIKLGAASSQCIDGCYSADTDTFEALYYERIKQHKNKNVKQLLYVGRYVGAKNMRRMERAFLQALEMSGGQWELVCIGTGPLWEERECASSIKHLGYKHPDELVKYVKNADVFVLPSLYEPWGVVIHEFATLGLPILCSTHVHAAHKFVCEGVNGFLFEPYCEAEIAKKMCAMMRLSFEELLEMGKVSHELGMSYNLSDWAARVVQFVEK